MMRNTTNMYVGQQMRVTPKSWLAPQNLVAHLRFGVFNNFIVSMADQQIFFEFLSMLSARASHLHDEKLKCYAILIDFDKHVFTGQNTQHTLLAQL
jgi:hypothetical protein